MIINLPKDLERDTTHRYGPNSFKLHRCAALTCRAVSRARTRPGGVADAPRARLLLLAARATLRRRGAARAVCKAPK